jgi:hypothetical protein
VINLLGDERFSADATRTTLSYFHTLSPSTKIRLTIRREGTSLKGHTWLHRVAYLVTKSSLKQLSIGSRFVSMCTDRRCGLTELGHLRKIVTCVYGGKSYYVHDVIKIGTEITKLTVMLLRRSFLCLLAYRVLISLDTYSNLVAYCVRKNNILVFSVRYAVMNSYYIFV